MKRLENLFCKEETISDLTYYSIIVCSVIALILMYDAVQRSFELARMLK